MKRKLLLISVLVVLGMPLGMIAMDAVQTDSCLDSGGAWFGQLGCQTELPNIDRIVIDKSDRILFAYQNSKLVRKMPVSLGRSPIGTKVKEGDSKTPEGIYPVVAHKRDSSYFRALRLGYPTVEQKEAASKTNIDPGSDVMIHGIKNGLGWIGRTHLWVDWTRGCVAMTDGEIDWLYQSVADGTPVEIRA